MEEAGNGSNNIDVAIFECYNATSVSSVTFNDTVGAKDIFIYEISGAGGPGTSNSAHPSGSTTSYSITTAHDHDMIYTIRANGSGSGGAGSRPSGYTSLQAASSGNSIDEWNSDVGLAGTKTLSFGTATGALASHAIRLPGTANIAQSIQQQVSFTISGDGLATQAGGSFIPAINTIIDSSHIALSVPNVTVGTTTFSFAASVNDFNNDPAFVSINLVPTPIIPDGVQVPVTVTITYSF